MIFLVSNRTLIGGKVVYCKLVGDALRHCSVNECLVVEEGGVAPVCVVYSGLCV